MTEMEFTTLWSMCAYGGDDSTNLLDVFHRCRTMNRKYDFVSPVASIS